MTNLDTTTTESTPATETPAPVALRVIWNAKHGRFEVKAGKKVAASHTPAKPVPQTAIDGIIAGLSTEGQTPEALVESIEATLALLLARKASVVPDEYRYRYGADQNCGDDIALRLKDATTAPDGKVDLTELERIASANGVADRYDGWLVKGLNNGMLRMNLGNVLRGKARKGESVTI